MPMRSRFDIESTEGFEEDPRYAVSLREAWMVTGFWAAFTIALISVSWGLSAGRSAEEINYILGFPEWFFWSGLVTVLVFCVLPVFMVRYLFTEVPLSADHDEREETR